MRVSLEAGKQIDQERMPYGIGNFEYPLFGQERFHLVPGYDVALFQRLDSEVLAGALVLREDDFSEVAST